MIPVVERLNFLFTQKMVTKLDKNMKSVLNLLPKEGQKNILMLFPSISFILLFCLKQGQSQIVVENLAKRNKDLFYEQYNDCRIVFNSISFDSISPIKSENYEVVKKEGNIFSIRPLCLGTLWVAFDVDGDSLSIPFKVVEVLPNWVEIGGKRTVQRYPENLKQGEIRLIAKEFNLVFPVIGFNLKIENSKHELVFFKQVIGSNIYTVCDDIGDLLKTVGNFVYIERIRYLEPIENSERFFRGTAWVVK